MIKRIIFDVFFVNLFVFFVQKWRDLGEIYILPAKFIKTIYSRTIFALGPSETSNLKRHLIFYVKSGLRTKPHSYQKIDLDLKFLVLSLIPENLGSRTQTGRFFQLTETGFDGSSLGRGEREGLSGILKK